MKCVVHYEKDHPKQSTLQLAVGSNLNGLRISEITFENMEEIEALIANSEYLKHISRAMLRKEQKLNRGIL